MISFMDTVLLIVSIISTIITVPFALFGIYEFIMGSDDARRLLRELHIPLSYKQTLVIGFVNLAIMIIAYGLRAKLAGVV